LNTFRLPISYPFLLMTSSLWLFSRPRANAFGLARSPAAVSRAPTSISSETHGALRQPPHTSRCTQRGRCHRENPSPLPTPCSSKTTEHLGVAVLSASLGDVYGIPHIVLDGIGKCAQIVAARAHPDYWLERRLLGHHHKYSEFTILCQGQNCPFKGPRAELRVPCRVRPCCGHCLWVC
jgi:hypothetical protein